MTESNDLSAGEGVNEGSADATAESAEQHGGSGVTGALRAASEDGAPKGEYDPAPPVETGLPGSSSPAGSPGQQLEAGEG
jgi:hypothetical protein